MLSDNDFILETGIKFEFLSIKINEFNSKNTIKWIKQIFIQEGHKAFYIQYVFCNDDKLLEINRKYLGHDYLTDIITFDYTNELDKIAGDIFISYDRVIDNAKKYKVSVIDELNRVIIHGVLHLLGYDDKTEHQRVKMRYKENYYLTLLKDKYAQ